MRRWIWAALAVAVALAGCPMKGMKIQEAREDLNEAAVSYNDYYYWRNFDRAVFFVVPEMRADFVIKTEPLKKTITINESRIVNIEMSPDAATGAVQVSRSYAVSPDPTVKTETITQRWVRVEGAWYIAGPPY